MKRSKHLRFTNILETRVVAEGCSVFDGENRWLFRIPETAHVWKEQKVQAV